MTTHLSNTSPSKSQLSKSRGWLPLPWLSLLLALTWLALSQSIAMFHLLAAVLIAIVIPLLIRPLLPEVANRLRPLLAFKLMLVVIYDIIMSNITVAKIVLGPMDRPQPMWLDVPLACCDETVNSLFAMIITMTPGTVSSTINETRRVIVVHALDCDDPIGAIEGMKQRYETALMAMLMIEPDVLPDQSPNPLETELQP
jgi:multicomponent K+:H+ antiporter subunit E